MEVNGAQPATHVIGPTTTGLAGAMPAKMPVKGSYFGPGKATHGERPRNAKGLVLNGVPFVNVSVIARAKAGRRPKLKPVEGAATVEGPMKRKRGRPKKFKTKRTPASSAEAPYDMVDPTMDDEKDVEGDNVEEVEGDEEEEAEDDDEFEAVEEVEDEDDEEEEWSEEEELLVPPKKRRRDDIAKIRRGSNTTRKVVYCEPPSDDEEFGIEDLPAFRDPKPRRAAAGPAQPGKSKMGAGGRKGPGRPPKPKQSFKRSTAGPRPKTKTSSEIQLEIMGAVVPHLVSSAEAHVDADADPTAKYEMQSAACVSSRYSEYLRCRVCYLKKILDEGADGQCRFEGFRVFGFKVVRGKLGELTYGPFFEKFEEAEVAGSNAAMVLEKLRERADYGKKSVMEVVVRVGRDGVDEDDDEDTVIQTDAATERSMLIKTAPTMLAVLRRDLPILRRALKQSNRLRVPVVRCPPPPPSARPPACDACRTALPPTHYWACSVCCKRLCDACFASFGDPTPKQQERAREELGRRKLVDRREPVHCLREYLHRKAQWMLVVRRGDGEVTASRARVEGLLTMVVEEERKEALEVVKEEEREEVEMFLSEEDLADDSDGEIYVGEPSRLEKAAAAAEGASRTGSTVVGKTGGKSRQLERAVLESVTIDGAASAEEAKAKFDTAWGNGSIVVFRHAPGDEELLKADWSAEGVADLLPKGAEAMAVDCVEAATGTVNVVDVLRGFDEPAVRPKEFKKEEHGNNGGPETTGTNSQAMTLRIEHFPQLATLKSLLPVYHFDYITTLPFPHRTGPESALNLAARLASSAAGDMAPKLLIGYCSTGQDRSRETGTLPLRVEPTDTVTGCFIASMPPGTANTATKAGEAGEAADEAVGDDVAVVWDVYAARDRPALRNFMVSEVRAGRLRVGGEPTKMSGSKSGRGGQSGAVREVEDVIWDGSLFLDAGARARLLEATGVRGVRVMQRLSESVILPAGCAKQARFLKDCVLATSGFLSPESVPACYRLMEERRKLSAGHVPSRNAVLHLSTALWETWGTSPYF